MTGELCGRRAPTGRIIGALFGVALATLAAPAALAQSGSAAAYDHAALSPNVRAAADGAVASAQSADDMVAKARSNEAGMRVISFDSGARYEGQVEGERLQGLGVLTWPNGNKHAGAYKDGVREGLGVFYFSNGWRYEGEWANDKYNGYGALFTETGALVQAGAWANGEFLGADAAPLAPAAPYELAQVSGPAREAGERALTAVANAEAAAQRARAGEAGVKAIELGEGRRYEGETTASGGLHGYGVLTWPNGDRHAGLYKDGVRSGSGAFFFGDGRRYLGDWLNDKYNGYGVLFRGNGSLEEAGGWRNNEYFGPEAPPPEAPPAVKYDISGLALSVREAAVDAREAVSRAEAAAKNARDGQAGTSAIQMDPEGRYEGEVDAKGVLNGYGVLTWPNGDRHAGQYKNGVRSGPGVFYFGDGRRYEGDWTNDKYGGLGVLFRADGGVDDAGRWSENELTRSITP